MADKNSMRRKGFIIRGQVQGVGFRPFVHGLARSLRLTGFVRNTPLGVEAQVQGAGESLENFAGALISRPPPLARITQCREQELPVLPEETDFHILPSLGPDHPPGGEENEEGSASLAGLQALVSPDAALCAQCRQEMGQPRNRRYRYPFTNCTNCGPRYTITRSLPYDRAGTSMACFPMCARCRAEYENPEDRRFHAQPNACPLCGPKLWFQTGHQDRDSAPQGRDALRAAARLLARGGILALKGLGGFHLACNANDNAAVKRLRALKQRPHKPFALMVPDLHTARKLAVVGPEEEALLVSPEHPIVLCNAQRQWNAAGPPPGLSPDSASLGLMLPYTPLHLALFDAYALALGQTPEKDGPAALVMTSGNPRGAPLCLGNREALSSLKAMADGFLLHDRDILVRVDDSVLRPLPGRGTLFFRRARGYVPGPVSLPAGPGTGGKNYQASGKSSNTLRTPIILGAGAGQRVTLCLTRDNNAFVSQYIGDLDSPAVLAFYREAAAHLASLLGVTPDVVVRDLHPDYMSSLLAQESGLPTLALQHHYAHAHALLAEHGYCPENKDAPVLILALDGTGLGEDGSLWGGEALLIRRTHAGTPPEHRRLAHLAPMVLPGGEAAIREPWRIAHSLMLALNLWPESAPTPCWLPEHEDTANLLPALLGSSASSWQSTSCGRLFDAVAALLGLCSVITYDGQAAIRLEEAFYRRAPQEGHLGAKDRAPPYPCPVLSPAPGKDTWVLDTHTLFASVWEDWRKKTSVQAVSARFHRGLATGLAELAARLAKEHGFSLVGLTGGCLQNRTLALELALELEQRGLKPLLHHKFSPNDECISLGQAAWGRCVLG